MKQNISEAQKQNILEHLHQVEGDRNAGISELTLAELESRLNAMLAEMV